MKVDFASVDTIPIPENTEAIILRPAPPRDRFSDEEFGEFCAQHRDLRIEMNSEGEMIIMLPVVTDGGRRSFLLAARFGAWVEADGTGVGFDSSTGFTLPNRAKRAPDVSWIRRERWEALTKKQRNDYAPICPDFVVELRSKTDRLKTLQAKMEEYIANGAQLGWLLDPLQHKVHIYCPASPVEIRDNPSDVSSEPLLKGFSLKLEGILD